jgi:hypothetical protein
MIFLGCRARPTDAISPAFYQKASQAVFFKSTSCDLMRFASQSVSAETQANSRAVKRDGARTRPKDLQGLWAYGVATHYR